MTLQLLHPEFPYIRGKLDFLFYQCNWVATRLLGFRLPLLCATDLQALTGLLRSSVRHEYYDRAFVSTVFHD
jgi:hypothetical protein